MADQWASTDDHAPKPAATGGWASTDDHAPVPEGHSIGGFLSNVLSSGAKMATDIGSAIVHPVDTLKAIGSIPVGLAEKAGIPVGTAAPGEQDAAKTLDAIIDHFKERYGSFEKAKESLYKDPVGVLADVSTAAGGFGGLMKGAGAVADVAGATKAAGIAGDVAKAARTVAEVTDPVAAITKPVSAAVGATKLPERLYQSALKPGAAAGDAAAAAEKIQTGLQHKIPVSDAGVDRLHDLINDLGQKIQDKIDAGAGSGVTVDPQSVASRADQIKPQFANQVNNSADLDAIDASKKQFLTERGAKPGKPAVAPQPTGVLDAQGRPIMTAGTPATPPTPAPPIPADKAQQIKQGTYQQIKKSYGQLSSAQVEAQKALARGIKEELAAQIPEIASLNATDSRLIGLQKALENRVRVAANHNIIGIGAPILGTAVAHASQNGKLGLVTGIVKHMLEDPAVKSKLAIAMNGARSANPRKFGAPSIATAVSRVNEYLDGLSVPAMADQPQTAPTLALAGQQ